jgi:NAD-dependent SIR2 family protein deacetylase
MQSRIVSALDEQLVARAAEIIGQADGLIIAAGAGLGVDSGLPDFRSNNGFWKTYPALQKSKINFHQIASPTAFRKRPEIAWGFYGHRLLLYRTTLPHSGFELLEQWGGNRPKCCGIFTSNVDGQFQRAGFPDTSIHECHGSIHYLQCIDSCTDAIWSADGFVPEVDMQTCRLLSPIPRCQQCGAIARPNILMFNDTGWVEDRAAQQESLQQAWLAGLRQPVVIEIGVGVAIPSVRRFSQYVIDALNGTLIRINPVESRVTRGRDVGLKAGALGAITAINQSMQHQ